MQYLSFDFRQLWNLDLNDRHHAAFHGAVKLGGKPREYVQTLYLELVASPAVAASV